MTFHKDSDSKSNANLFVESLEDRMMLSTVSIHASGETGQETMNLLINGDLVATYENVSVNQSVYTYNTEETLSADQIRITFTNDLYEPEDGFDRNLIVDRIVVDGQTIESEAPQNFHSGVWNPNVGQIETGFLQSEILHTNGYIQFASAGVSVSQIDFAGRTWEVVDGPTTAANLVIDEIGPGEDLLNLRGGSGPLAISTQVEVEGGERYELTLDAFRDVFAGNFSNNGRPWATIGVNYYNFNGNLFDQDRVEINGSVDQVVEFDTPEGATTAFLWAWVDNFGPGVDIPLVIRNVDWQLDPISNVEDFEAPSASFNSFEFTDFGEQIINFGVNFQDNVRLGQISQGAITVTGPNGFQETPPIAIGAPDNTDTNQTLVFFVTAPGGEWTEFDNGIYNVTLNSGQLSDVAGNIAQERELGSFTVNISQPNDTTPPTVSLTSTNPIVITTPPTGGRGNDIAFGVRYDDDLRLGQQVQDRILIEGPNGYSGFGRGIAGGPIGETGQWELIYAPLPADGFWNSNDNGIYTISLIENTVFDFVGNAAPGQTLGAFEVRIDPVIDVA